MRLLVVTEQPEHNGSAHYRAIQLVPRLRALGADVRVSAPRVPMAPGGGGAGAADEGAARVRRAAAGSGAARVRGAATRARFFAAHAAAAAARARELDRELRWADAVLVQRGAYPLGPARVARPLLRFAGPLVLDLDDAVFLASPTLAARGRAARWLYGPQQAAALTRRADAIVVSTAAVGAALPSRRADRILPTIPDIAGYPRVVHRDAGPLTLGWVGSRGNLRYLDPLRAPLAALAADGVAELTVVCDAPWDGPARSVAWSRADDPALFGRLEVGLMPLPDAPYTRAKAGFKLLQHLAAGAAVVASPVGVNVELVERSRGGLLATTPDEWAAAIRTLAADPRRRRAMGADGAAFMRGYADLDAHAAQLLELLQQR